MTKLKYTPEIRERAVQLLIESEKDYPSNWAAITAIAPKIGCTPETLRVWYQKYLDKKSLFLQLFFTFNLIVTHFK